MTIDYPDYPFDFETDYAKISEKLTEARTLLDAFDPLDESAHKRLLSLLAHIMGRLNRCNTESSEDRKLKSGALVIFLNCNAALESKVRKHRREQLNLSAGLSLVGISSGSDSSDSDVEDALPVNSTVFPVQSTSRKSVPVSHWNLKFSGDDKTLSLSSFLERVEELQNARNVTDLELYNSGIDLFQGRAYTWYLSARRKAKDWSALVDLLRKQFQPPDYNDKLFTEIKNRTMGPTESLGIYLAVMDNLFGRLTVKVSGATRLKIIMNNISPFYQTQLALTEVQSVEHLLELGQRLEARKASVEEFRPPPSRKNERLLEPDLAYVCTGHQDSCAIEEVRNVQAMKCYNCNKLGHKAVQCDQPHRRRCFRCNRPNFTVRTCPTCNPNSGNGNPRR